MFSRKQEHLIRLMFESLKKLLYGDLCGSAVMLSKIVKVKATQVLK